MGWVVPGLRSAPPWAISVRRVAAGEMGRLTPPRDCGGGFGHDSLGAVRNRTCWVTGAGGLIGSAVATSPWQRAGWTFLPLRRPELELSDFGAVERRFAVDQPDAVIHCAAMSKSPQCQSDPDGARLWNVDVTRHLAGLFRGRRMLFLSTDLVFDGLTGSYAEDAAVNPLSFYAETKVEAEKAVLANPGHLVIRTSLNHGISPTGDRAFNEEMTLGWRSGRKFKFFTDEFRTPIPAVCTARALLELLGQDVDGILHVAGAERLSRWQIGQALAASLPGMECPMEPGSLKEYVGAPRSPDTSLDCRRAQALLSFPLPRYSEWLRDHGSAAGTGDAGA